MDGTPPALIAVNEKWRARQALLIAFENTRLIVRHGGPPRNGAGPPGTPDAADLRTRLAGISSRWSCRVEETVLQRLNVPTQARDYLPGIVRNQIERLSLVGRPGRTVSTPWRRKIRRSDARVLMTSRANVEAVAALAALGCRPTGSSRAKTAASAPSVTLWSRRQRTGQGLEARKPIGAPC